MDSNGIFRALRLILENYEPDLSVAHNECDKYYLNTPITGIKKKAEFFGAVQTKRSYVAFHLMPIYYYPELLNNIGQELKNRMQGKSCFNFREVDDELFAELSSLTKSSYDRYKLLGKV